MSVFIDVFTDHYDNQRQIFLSPTFQLYFDLSYIQQFLFLSIHNMFYDNNSLKLYDTVQNKSSTAEFQLFTMIDRYSNKVNELKMMEPLFFCDNTWFIDITTSKLQSPSKDTFHIFMELKNSDVTQVHNGSWTVILLAIDPRNNLKLHSTSLKQLVRFSLSDLRLYLTEVHSIMKFDIQITVVHHDSKKSYHSILHDLQRNYDDIAQSGNIQIITERKNETVALHKDILMLRSPVFKAMFDNNMTESSTNQIQIPDFDSITIKRMVEFLYKDTFTDIDGTSYEDFISLLAISNKYEVNSLKEASVQYLSKKITVDNVAEMRYSALLYDSSPLLNACLLFVRQHVHQLFKDDNSFLSKCVELGR